MTPQTVMDLMNGALLMMLKVSGPILAGGLAMGLLVGLFQAVTQIQELTLTFIPKILVTVLILMFGFPWMLQLMIDYTITIFKNVPYLAR